MVTHVVTCQGRDHIVSIRSGCRNLTVVNFHFEPELTLRSLRERLRLITTHCPLYPEAVGVIAADFDICEPEEGRFCKYNTSNDVFSRCKSVHKMATGKSDDQRVQPDNKLELGTSYKMKLGPKVNIGHECVVTMHDAYTNDNMITSTDFHIV